MSTLITLIRFLVLLVIALLLVQVAVMVGIGTTGPVEKAFAGALGLALLMSAWRVGRLRVPPPSH